MGDELNNKRRREFLGASAQALSGVVVVGSAMAATPDTPATSPARPAAPRRAAPLRTTQRER